MVKVVKFVLMDEVLYKKSFSQPYLRCLTLDESHYILRDIHEGPVEIIQGLDPLSTR